MKIECKTKNFEFEIQNGSQSVLIVNRKDVSQEEMRKDLMEFTERYEIKSVTDIPVRNPKGKSAARVAKKPPKEKKEKIEIPLPEPEDRKKEILETMSGEFSLSDVGDHFAGKGYDRKKTIDNVRHDIRTLVKEGKLENLGGMPKKYKLVSSGTTET